MESARGASIVNPEVVWRQVGETAVLVEMQGGHVFELEGPAVRIWELLVSGASEEEVVERLEREYDVDRATLERDIQRTLSELEESGLIRR